MQESLGWKNIVKEWEIPEIKTIYEMVLRNSNKPF